MVGLPMKRVITDHSDMALPFYRGRQTKSNKNSICPYPNGGGVAQWLGRRISDQGVPGSNPGRCTFRCDLEQVTFTLLSTG